MFKSRELALDPITECDECGSDVFPDDVFRTVPIPKAPGYLALVFKCETCAAVGKLAKDHDEWEELEARRALQLHNAEQVLAHTMEVELGGVLTVEYLQSLWRSLPNPPMLEDVMGSCKCEECKRKRGF